ncbi:SIS domain-containing protein [Cohaesibacter celericrescens]|uniref:SIS domain-containing protein n=1 Tax=Cohaesibacter celericrescens TaxID=2067669 RepID=UPI003569758D
MTIMAKEIASIPEVVANQLEQTLALYLAQGEQLRQQQPNCLITCARGSSDHAALFFKYLVESKLGVPVCSMGPSIASIYDQPIVTKNASLIAVSQSGGSKDLAALCSKAAQSGLATVALVNNTQSLLSKSAHTVLPIGAGEEKAVAATKTFVCSLVALASIFAGWAQDKDLIKAIHQLPSTLAIALQNNWMPDFAKLAKAKGLFVISRGPGIAIAHEAALKFKETCGLHAEAFSSAEVLHGPIALAQSNFAALCFATREEAGPGILETIGHLRDAHVPVLETSFFAKRRGALPVTQAHHPLLDPICQIVSFYRAVESLSVQLGGDPDSPALLSKVTVTL